MQYKVPQNVQREDTIIGPITLKQLIILGIGGTIAYALFTSLSRTYFWEIWLPPVAIIGAITLAFAFVKIHNLPFHRFLMNFLEYNLLPKKRIWIQGTATPFIPPFEEKKSSDNEKKLNQNNRKQKRSLKELMNIINTHGESELEDKNTNTNK